MNAVGSVQAVLQMVKLMCDADDSVLWKCSHVADHAGTDVTRY